MHHHVFPLHVYKANIASVMRWAWAVYAVSVRCAQVAQESCGSALKAELQQVRVASPHMLASMASA